MAELGRQLAHMHLAEPAVRNRIPFVPPETTRTCMHMYLRMCVLPAGASGSVRIVGADSMGRCGQSAVAEGCVTGQDQGSGVEGVWCHVTI